MGGSDAPKNTTTTTVSQVPAWLQSDYTDFINQTNAANAKPYQQYSGQLNAAPSGSQNYAGQIAGQGASYQLPGQQMQISALGNVLDGSNYVSPTANPVLNQTNPYAGQNAYLNNMVADSNKNITDAYNQNAVPALAAQFAQGGAFGGSAMQQAGTQSQDTLAKNLAQSTDNLRYQDYTSQQGLAEDSLNRNAALYQQGFQNQLSASQQNTANAVNASSGLNAINATQQGYLNQLNNYGQTQQDFAQGNIDQAYNNWYQQNYGYDQQKLNNYGNALNSISGNFQGSATTGANPAYKPKTAGGAATAALGGAATGAAVGSVVPVIGTGIGAIGGAIVGAGAYYL
jgi:hypothetical protein